MFRPLFVCLICIALSCRPESPSPDPRVWHVGPRALHNSYVDNSDRYTDQHIALVLPSDSYAVVGKEIRWHSTFKKNGPDIVFICHNPPAEGAPAIHVRGVCRGCSRDWFGKVTVRVEGCDVTPAQ